MEDQVAQDNSNFRPRVPRYYIVGILIGFALFYFSQSIFWQYGSYYLFAGIGETAFLLIGLVGGLPVLVGLMGMYFWGALSDHWHRRVPFMILGFAAQAIAFILYATPFVQTSINFLLITVAAGLFSSVAVPIANAYLTEAQTYKGSAVGLLLAIGSFGWAFGAFTGGLLFSQIGMMGLFLLGAGAYVIGGLVILILVREIPNRNLCKKSHAQDQTEPQKEKTASKGIILRILLFLALATAISAIGVNAFAFFFGVYLISELGGTPLMVGIANGFAALIGLGVTFAAGYSSDRFGRKPILLIGFAGYAIFMIVYFFIINPWIAMIAWMIPIYTMIYTASYSAAADISRVSHRGRAMSVIATANSLGTGIGPIIGGVLVQFFIATLRINMILAAALNIIALFVVILFVPETLKRRRQSR